MFNLKTYLEITDFDFEGFEPLEVKGIIDNRVCAQCFGRVTEFPIPNDRLSLIICVNCGENCERLGTLANSTISIREDENRRNYPQFIKNLSDLFPTLQNTIRTEGEILKELGF